MHQTKALGLLAINRERCDGEISAASAVLRHEMGVVHPVELVTRKDQHLVDVPLLQQPFVFANGISCAFEPTGALWCLLGSQHFNKSLIKPRREVEGLGDMAIQ